MPIEIKELHIRVAVNTAGDKRQSGPSEGGGSVARGGPALDETVQNALVAECVEQVLEILQQKDER